MSDSWVRVIGTLRDSDGAEVRIGVDYETVTIGRSAQPIRLGAIQREEFSRLYFEAERQAEATMPP